MLLFILTFRRWLPGCGLPHPPFPRPPLELQPWGRQTGSVTVLPVRFRRYHLWSCWRPKMDDEAFPIADWACLVGPFSPNPFGSNYSRRRWWRTLPPLRAI